MKDIKKKIIAIISAFVLLFTSLFFALNFETLTAGNEIDNNYFAMESGASLKLSDEGGMRFIVKMGSNVKDRIINNEDKDGNPIKDVNLCFIVTLDSFFDACESKDYYNDLSKKIVIEVDENKIYGEDDYFYANGCVVNIRENNRTRNYVCISCIISTYDDDQVTYEYSKFLSQDDTTISDNRSDTTRSFYEVVNKTVLSDKKIDEEDYAEAVLKYEAYSNWYGTSNYPIVVNTKEQGENLASKIVNTYMNNANYNIEEKSIVINEEVTNEKVTQEDKIIKTDDSTEIVEVSIAQNIANAIGKATDKTIEISKDESGNEIFENIDVTSKTLVKLPNIKSYLYRVGNKNTVPISSIFTGSIDKVTIETVSNATGVVIDDKLQFSGLGVVKLKAYSGLFVSTLYLEVVNAINVTSIDTIDSNNVCIFNDIGYSGREHLKIKNGYTLYANGYTIYCGSDGGTNAASGLNSGYIYISGGGGIDNARIIAPDFPRGYLYADNNSYDYYIRCAENKIDDNHFRYQLSTICITDDASLKNCYIYGGRTNVLAIGDNINIKLDNCILENGSIANLHCVSTTGSLTLNNLTTIQNIRDVEFEDLSNNETKTSTVYGFGILMGPAPDNGNASSNVTLNISGSLNQYNWIGEDKIDTITSSQMAETIFNKALANQTFVAIKDDVKYVNAGIIYLNSQTATINDTSSTKDNYDLSNVSFYSKTGQAYSIIGSNASIESISMKRSYKSTRNSTDLLYFDFADSKYDVDLNCNSETKELFESLTIELEAFETYDLVLSDISVIETGIKQKDISYVLDGEEVTSDYVIKCTETGRHEIICSGTTKGYYDASGNFVVDEHSFTKTLIVNIYAVSIDPPVLTVGTNYRSTSNLFTSSTSGDHTIVAKALNDVFVTYYSRSRKGYITIPLTLFTPTTNGKLDKTWSGSYDGCNLTIESTQAIHASQNDFGYFVVYNGVMYLTNSKLVSSSSGARSGAIKYTFTDNNSDPVTLSPGARTENRNTKQSTSSSSSQYMVRVDVGFGTISKSEFGPYSSGSSATLDTPRLEGHTFAGWYDAPTNGNRVDVNGVYTTTGNNVVLYAYWKDPLYITYDANGGVCEENTVMYDGLAITLPSATNGNKKLVGWYDSLENGNLIGKENESYHPSDNITLYAIWRDPTVLTFDPVDGECETKTITMVYDSNVILPEVTTSQYKWFNGWKDSSGNIVGKSGDNYVMPFDDSTLTADWKDKYDVVFDPQGGLSVSPLVYSGSELTLPEVTNSNDDLAFAGWYDASEGGNLIGFDGDKYTPTKNTTLYARWNIKITVTYDAMGGNCETSSDIYDGVNDLILPTISKDGCWFVGWYDASESGNLIGKENASYKPTEDITLYAIWDNVYTVTYVPGDGASVSKTTESYTGTALTLQTPTKTGYDFNGWYDASEDGNLVGSANQTYIPETDITVYAYWTIHLYTLKLTLSNASGSISYGDTTVSTSNGTIKVPYNETVTITCSSFSQSNDKSVKFGSSSLGSDVGTWTKTMPASDTTVSMSSSSGTCFASGTLITLSDGSKKAIENLTSDDQLLVWNFITGKYESSTTFTITNHGCLNRTILNLNFNNNSSIEIINKHGLFDTTLNQFVIISENNVEQYMGHFFAINNGQTIEKVELVSYELYTKNTEAYSIISITYLDVFANNILTIDPSIYFLFPFEIDDDMKYDEDKMIQDIETYGLLTYEEFKPFAPERTETQFYAISGQYMKVALGKGIVTMDEIVAYAKFIDIDQKEVID